LFNDQDLKDNLPAGFLIIILITIQINMSESADFEKREAIRRLGPIPVDALQAFGARVEKWRNFGF
jgi:hypothetical protein